MHAKQLVELAGWVAAHGHHLVESSLPLPDSALQEYWVASKCRLERWRGTLWGSARRPGEKPEAFSAGEVDLCLEASLNPPVQPSGRVRVRLCTWQLAVLEEILLSELFSRVWTALLHAYSHRHATPSPAALAQNLLVDHLELRTRVLRLLLEAPAPLQTQIGRLNQLRSHLERWADFLLGGLAHLIPTQLWAFDPLRMQDFAEEFSPDIPLPVRQQTWRLALGSLQRAFKTHLIPFSPNPDCNQAIASTVLACFAHRVPPTELDHPCLIYLEILHRTDQVQTWVNSLLQEELAETSGLF